MELMPHPLGFLDFQSPLYWDTLVTSSLVLGEQINFIGKKELFNPFTGWFFTDA